MTLNFIFDLLTPKVDRFVPFHCSVNHLPVCTAIFSKSRFRFQNIAFTRLATNGRTDGRHTSRKHNISGQSWHGASGNINSHKALYFTHRGLTKFGIRYAYALNWVNFWQSVHGFQPSSLAVSHRSIMSTITMPYTCVQLIWLIARLRRVDGRLGENATAHTTLCTATCGKNTNAAIRLADLC